jgi:hypothetical protein
MTPGRAGKILFDQKQLSVLPQSEDVKTILPGMEQGHGTNRVLYAKVFEDIGRHPEILSDHFFLFPVSYFDSYVRMHPPYSISKS